MLIATFDERLGLIVTIATGFQSEEEIEKHVAAIGVLAKTARARTGRILHLVDAMEAAVQPPSGSKWIAKHAARHRLNVDRCAVVMTSTLGKMQVRRLYKDLPLQVFESRRDAIGWLKSYQSIARIPELPVRIEHPAIRPG